ncbi:uncharacterized protein LOC107426974 isoform X4 [Ziziphus jujuba]|uniref:Uncharacterized protein LOC107426974 isoform X4 n=1 Tax=Ziziphus jujuba TaxID=326968 RepID=A0ABM3HZY6_ZIZJJ|nr:uncharacterized protein LOC107426974 isoform X4 [Ziziphus jujuba]
MVGPMINSFVFMNIKDLKTYVLYKLRISTVLLAENCWVILHPSRPFCINQGKTRLDEDQGSNMEKLDLFLIVQLLKALLAMMMYDEYQRVRAKFYVLAL